SATADGDVNLWRIPSLALVTNLEGHATSMSHTAFSPDSQLLAGSTDKNIRLWDLASGKIKRIFETPAAAGVWSIAFTPDSKNLIACRADGTVKVWDLSAEPPPVISPNRGVDLSFGTFSSDSKLLIAEEGPWAILDAPHTVNAWDARTHRLLGN